MQITGVWVETTHNPCRYTTAQIELAAEIAGWLNRGKLTLLEEPKR